MLIIKYKEKKYILKVVNTNFSILYLLYKKLSYYEKSKSLMHFKP